MQSTTTPQNITRQNAKPMGIRKETIGGGAVPLAFPAGQQPWPTSPSARTLVWTAHASHRSYFFLFI